MSGKIEIEADKLSDEIYGLCCDIGRLECENAKLRELVRDMWHSAMMHMDFTDRYVFIGEFNDRIRELEVVVTTQ